LIKKDPEKLDAPFCLVLYDTDADGRCVPSYTASEYNEDIGVYYAQRQEELKRLHSEVIDGKISPVGLFFHLQHMTLGDLAKRVGLRPGLVEKHMTQGGFKSATVDQLQKYAKVFDVTVADFFEFYFISDEIVTKSTKHHDRLILQTVFSVQKS
jgi:hypothetical protein